MIISIIFMGIGMLVSYILKSKFQSYSKIPSQHGLSGQEIAQKMLDDHGLNNVKIISVQGQLSDHYNPLKKTVNLSPEVFKGRNAAAAAVAAHECGHAVQHAHAYKPLDFRTKLVPLQNASGMILNVIMMITIFGGAILYEAFPVELVLIVICCVYGVFALFSIITLPVEFDASKRALVWMEKSGLATKEEHARSKDALKWAAMTYVIAALAALTTLLYYILMLTGRRNN